MNPLAAILALLGVAAGMGGGGGGSKGDPAPEPAAPPVPAPEPAPEDPPAPEPVDPPAPEPVDPPAPEPVDPPAPEPVDPPAPEPVDPPAPEPVDPPATGIEPADLGGGPVTVTAGRVAHLAPEDHETAQSVRIIEGPEYGNVTVNPDNTLALVLTGTTQTDDIRIQYEITHADGRVETLESTLNVQAGTQDAGWGQGNHYLLETDENDKTIVETGDDHRKVYISESEDALSRADIAALEGLDEGDITRDWLIANDTYGADEEMALATDVGMDLWYGITGETVEPNSNWLLFEKGYEYNDLGRLVTRGLQGEDELHPAHITSWGEGEKPIISSQIDIFQRDTDNLVFSDVHLQGGLRALIGSNVIFDDVEVSENGFNLQNIDSVTIRNSHIYDIFLDEPATGEDWHPHSNRLSGVFSATNESLLIENTLIAQVGWEQGFSEDGDGAFPQPPNQFSQNVYATDDSLDLTFRDNVSTHGASWGLQARAGGFIEDNLFSENNAGFITTGGSSETPGFTGNYMLANGNVVTSAAYKIAPQIGALSVGLQDNGSDSSLLDNIVAHLADPNDPDDIALKVFNNGGVRNIEEAFFDNSIQYNWVGTRASPGQDPDRNTEGLDPTTLDATTLNALAQAVLGDPNADADDLAEYLKHNDFETDSLLAFFKEAFGVETYTAPAGATHSFVPDVLGGGIRWDNRINWDTEVVPGQNALDSVDLRSNFVNYAANSTLRDLTFGDGGELTLFSGKLTIEGQTFVGTGMAEVNVVNAGQFWTNGVAEDGSLIVDIDAGRFANTGEITGGVSLTSRAAMRSSPRAGPPPRWGRMMR
ncbi:right-handed parallel beta-helix repeat-containing protein [Tateyamaria armeniaca]|uniref:Right-handed parallel beta-helix repeat-containing protein n=1 Tax=Tateyamaria armeniaca TaxID=2518930 RepID=A0ABW8UT16_9RHOB